MGKIADEFAKQIEEEFKRMGKQPGSLEELNKVAAIIYQRHNNGPISDFEGLSPNQMHLLNNFLFNENCPVKIKPILTNAELLDSPFLQMAIKLLEIINKSDGLKLTEKGNLPRKTVLEINELGYIKSDDKYLIKILKEEDYFPLHICNIIVKISGITVTKKGKIFLTKKGTTCLKDHFSLFSALLSTFCLKFNKAYMDRYEGEEIGNVGAGFVLYLLSKFGNEKRDISFYSEKYVRAFPMLKDQIKPIGTISISDLLAGCLKNRLFWVFSLFGLIELEEQLESNYRSNYQVKTTTLFNNAILSK